MAMTISMCMEISIVTSCDILWLTAASSKQQVAAVTAAAVGAYHQVSAPWPYHSCCNQSKIVLG